MTRYLVVAIGSKPERIEEVFGCFTDLQDATTCLLENYCSTKNIYDPEYRRWKVGFHFSDDNTVIILELDKTVTNWRKLVRYEISHSRLIKYKYDIEGNFNGLTLQKLLQTHEFRNTTMDDSRLKLIGHVVLDFEAFNNWAY